MLLGGVFKATGNHSPIEVPAKGRYTLHDLARYAKRYGVPLAFNPAFPINTLTLMRGAQGYLGGEGFQPYLLRLVGDEQVKEGLKATTEEAVRRGVFGAPSFFVGDQLFFGQDRLDFVAEALAG